MAMDSRFDLRRAVKAALAAALSVALLAGISMVVLDHADFVDWGWLIGPSAWVVACLLGARAAGLSLLAGLSGAAIAGIPSLIATLTGIHWLGVVIGLSAFAAWCGSAKAGSIKIA